MKHTLLYVHDCDSDRNAVIDILDSTAKIYFKVKPYEKRFYANRYLIRIMSGQETLPAKPDETIGRNPGESDEDFQDRVSEGFEHIGFFRTIWPDPSAETALQIPKIYSVCYNVFPPSMIWYETDDAAKKDADGIDTVYLGFVEVYDSDEVKRIEAEIASYNE